MYVTKVLRNLTKRAARNATEHYAEHGVKPALQGVVQSVAAHATLSGGLAALQGDDVWEAAKTGAFRGALMGTGYQSLKFATKANKETVRGNLKHIAKTSKSAVSTQLKTVLRHKRMTEKTKAAFGHK